MNADENAFAKLVMGSSLKSAEQEMQFKESELKKLQARDKELDKIFKALIQKGRRCAIRYEKDWSREYSPYGKCWVNHYGYVTV